MKRFGALVIALGGAVLPVATPAADSVAVVSTVLGGALIALDITNRKDRT